MSDNRTKYSIEDIQKKLNEYGFNHSPVAGVNNMEQLGERNTTIHRARTNYILYSTQEDFDAIRVMEGSRILETSNMNSDTVSQTLNDALSQYPDAIICVRNGNHILNPGAPKYQPHRVYCSTDQIIDRIIDTLASKRGLIRKTTEKKVHSEWVVPGNPKYYDIINAFRELKKIDWKQSTNVEVGDVVYIYAADPYQSICFKCKVNKVDLEKLEIDDRKFELTDNFGASDGRYMELEMLEELKGIAYSRQMVERHSFSAPRGPVRLNPDTREYLDIVQEIQHSSEMDPDKHDGSYELARETVRAYKNMGDLSQVDYKDMNLIFHMVIGTWKQKVEIKKKSVVESHLPEKEKERLNTLLDSVWNKALNKEYSNRVGEASIGMFGTGFYSFRTDNDGPKRFIRMCTAILDMEDDDAIFDVCQKALSSGIPGMKSASGSEILHCLKPYTFPIFNSNKGHPNIFEYLGVDLEKLDDLSRYIENCRKVREYRDQNFTVKNYRLYDIMARRLDKKIQIDYIGVLNYLENNQEIPYSNPDEPGIDPAEKKRLLSIKENGQKTVGEMKKMAEECQKQYNLNKCIPGSWLDGSNTKTRKYLWTQMKYSSYADDPTSISIFVENNGEEGSRYRISLEIKNDGTDKKTVERYHSYLDMPINYDAGLVLAAGSNEWGHPIVLSEPQETVKEEIREGKIRKVQLCKYIERTPDETNDYYHEELLGAVELLIPYYEHVLGIQQTEYTEIEETEMSKIQEFGLNTILYGPPGTGKTYNTVRIAVAICEPDLNVDEMEYKDVLVKYNELKDKGRIEFTTFHQSYGYEEFIEGIKPVVDTDSSDISYTIEDGMFKRFCESAKVVRENDAPYTGEVWVVRSRSGDKSVTSDFEDKLYSEGVIKIEDINDDNRQCGFFNDMASGDWVVLGKKYTINAIGVIIDDVPEEIEDGIFHYQRKVDWKATGLSIDCRGINRGKSISNFTIAKSWMRVQDLQSIVDGKAKNEEPYVFIIDEINRGNISKIFGELITLIEKTKRDGTEEAMEATLPYSGDRFSVPSNVYILGTMNTADRSIALMDTALRRRFDFVEMMPDPDVIKDIVITDGDETLYVAEMLKTINKRVEYLFDREHTIGHAFFTGLTGENATMDNLADVFKNKVIPLLQEYFYEDYEKIQFVLGDNEKSKPDYKFILDDKAVVDEIFKGRPDLDVKEKMFRINDDAFNNIQSYIEITETRKVDKSSEEAG